MKKQQITKQTGFTIVELLIVIVVIAILAAVTVVAFAGLTQRAKDSSDEANTTNIIKKVAELQAINGKYEDGLLLSGTSIEGGVLSIDDVARLSAAGVQADMLRNPDAPAGVMNSFVFDQYNTGTNQWLSEMDDSETIRMATFMDIPAGYSNWDDVWNDVWSAADAFYIEYVQSYPEPEDYESVEWNSWYTGFQSAFFVENPQFNGLDIATGEGVRVDVPKTQVYFVQLLGDSALPEDSCPYGGGGKFTCFHFNGSGYDIVPITGMKVLYYNRSSGEWKEKVHGTGQPFGNVYDGSIK